MHDAAKTGNLRKLAGGDNHPTFPQQIGYISSEAFSRKYDEHPGVRADNSALAIRSHAELLQHSTFGPEHFF